MNRNQLDNIFARLKPVVLHQDGLGLDDLLSSVAAPRMRLGRWDRPDHATFYAEVARDEPDEPQTSAGPDDDAVILFTSGTSARPKGVVLNYREHLGNIDPRALAEGFGITADDRVYDFLIVQLGLGPARGRAGSSQPRRHPGHDGKVPPAASSTTSAITALPSPPATRPRSTSCSTPRRMRIVTICPRFVITSSSTTTIEEWRRFEARFAIPLRTGYGSATGTASWPFPARRCLGTEARGCCSITDYGRRRRRPIAAARRDRPVEVGGSVFTITGYPP